MSYSAFTKLLAAFEAKLPDFKQTGKACKNGEITTPVMLAITLRYLAGASYIDVYQHFGLSIGSFYRNIWITINCLNSLAILKFPDPWQDAEALAKLAADFEALSYLGLIKHCVGAIDGFIAKIWQPPASDDVQVTAYHCARKDCFGLNVQAVCDAFGRFLWVGVHCPASAHDRQAFQSSGFAQWLRRHTLGAYYLVGDNAYVCTQYMVTPFKNASFGSLEDNTNFYISQLRNIIERAFGRLVNKWGIFWRPMRVSLAHASDIIMVTCRLHNYCYDEDTHVYIPPSSRKSFRSFKWKKVTDATCDVGYRLLRTPCVVTPVTLDDLLGNLAEQKIERKFQNHNEDTNTCIRDALNAAAQAVGSDPVDSNVHGASEISRGLIRSRVRVGQLQRPPVSRKRQRL
jgi:hypothetical protein